MRLKTTDLWDVPWGNMDGWDGPIWGHHGNLSRTWGGGEELFIQSTFSFTFVNQQCTCRDTNRATHTEGQAIVTCDTHVSLNCKMPFFWLFFLPNCSLFWKTHLRTFQITIWQYAFNHSIIVDGCTTHEGTWPLTDKEKFCSEGEESNRISRLKMLTFPLSIASVPQIGPFLPLSSSISLEWRSVAGKVIGTPLGQLEGDLAPHSLTHTNTGPCCPKTQVWYWIWKFFTPVKR